jgi:hypothetical protein
MDPTTTQALAKAVEESAKTAGRGLEIVHDTGGIFIACSVMYPRTSLGSAVGLGYTNGTFAFVTRCADAPNKSCERGTCRR